MSPLTPLCRHPQTLHAPSPRLPPASRSRLSDLGLIFAYLSLHTFFTWAGGRAVIRCCKLPRAAVWQAGQDVVGTPLPGGWTGRVREPDALLLSRHLADIACVCGVKLG